MIIIDARFGKYSELNACNNITRTSKDVTIKVREMKDPITGNISWGKNHAHRFFGDPIFKVRKAIKIWYQEVEGGPTLIKCFPESNNSARNIKIFIP